MTSELIRLLAAWALIHETADEGWKAAVTRGKSVGTGGMEGGPEAFVDGLSAMVAEEKERLKASLAAGKGAPLARERDLSGELESLRFEMGQIRSRLESIETAIDTLLARRGGNAG